MKAPPPELATPPPGSGTAEGSAPISYQPIPFPISDPQNWVIEYGDHEQILKFPPPLLQTQQLLIMSLTGELPVCLNLPDPKRGGKRTGRFIRTPPPHLMPPEQAAAMAAAGAAQQVVVIGTRGYIVQGPRTESGTAEGSGAVVSMVPQVGSSPAENSAVQEASPMADTPPTASSSSTAGPPVVQPPQEEQ